jgi:hypothetical protein
LALTPLTRDELHAELEALKCECVTRNGPRGYSFWETKNGKPFSVPPPEILVPGSDRYSQRFLDDLINELGLNR